MKNKLVILSPVFNEERNINNFVEEVEKNLKNTDIIYKIYFVDDGSKDNSSEIIKKLLLKKSNIYCICLSRNFGKEVALSAGINEIDNYDGCIILDIDLQHPPSLLPRMIEEWRKGKKIVWTVRKNIKHSILRVIGSKLFFFIMSRLSKNFLKPNTTDYVLLDKIVINQLKQFSEKNRFFRGLINFLGYESSYLEFEAPGRKLGQSSFSYRRLLSLALETIASYTLLPLKLTGFFGILVMFFTFLLFFYMTISNIFNFNFFTPLAFIIVFNSFLFGILMTSIGLLGLYIGQIHYEVKNRPLYFIDEKIGNK